LDLDSGALGSEEILGEPQKAGDPILGGSSLEGNSVRWKTSGLPALENKAKRKHLIVTEEEDALDSRPSPSKKTKT
jgi:hypothetical protein